MIICYSIYDTELKKYGTLFLGLDDIVIKRQVSNLVNSSQNPYKHFEDKFELHKLGDFNENTGELRFKKEVLFNLNDLVNKSVDIGGNNGSVR